MSSGQTFSSKQESSEINIDVNNKNDKETKLNHENTSDLIATDGNHHSCDTKDENNEKENTDNNKTIKYENIDVTKITVDNRPLRIYLDGVFDMAHYGHYRLFKAIKDKFPNSTVIVGVSGDEDTIRLKGETLMNEKERAESIESCKWVDKVICPCPWVITQEFLDKEKIDYVAHDGLPYVSEDSEDIYDFVKKQGRFIATQRTNGISTTELINRIVKRYNEFVLRNLNRGVSRSDLNVSWAREKRIQLSAKFDQGKEKVLQVRKKGFNQ